MKKIYLVIVIILLLIHFFLGIDAINHMSPTFDENSHLAAGYSYWKTGKYDMDLDHPPVSKMFAAIPLLFMKPLLLKNHPYWINFKHFTFSDVFIYENTVDPEKMLNSARIMMLFFSCLLGFIVFLWAKQLYGILSGIFALLLYIFSSNFISHGVLVTTDVAGACFYFSSIYFFWYWLNNQKIKTTVLLALSTVLALTTRFSGVLVLLLFGIFILLPPVRKKIRLSGKQYGFHIGLFLLVTIVLLLIIYKFKYIGLYNDGLFSILTGLKSGHPSFLMGQHSLTGWKYYYLVAFLIKTPIPVLLFISFSLIIGRRKLLSSTTIVLLLPVILLFTASSLSKKQLGIRYILPVYPFLFVWISGIILFVKQKYSSRHFYYFFPVFIVLVSWYVVSCIKVHPWQISYFNEFIGGPKNGYKYLTDSSVDWGHGLKELGKWYKSQDLDGIYLSYFGTGDPHYYGIKYLPIGTTSLLSPERRVGDNIDILSKKRVILAISVTNLQSTYYQNKKLFDILKKYKPEKMIAYSIFVYDFTNKPKLLKKL